MPKLLPYRSLYFHMPFCESKCHYCDFYSIGAEKTKIEMHRDFERAVTRELETNLGLISPKTDSIFFGGGTPTMSSLHLFERIFAILKNVTDLSQAEITTEANPSSISHDKMLSLRELGINRVSMGVQSTDNKILKSLGRVHSRDDAEKALSAAFSAGFENVSVDLMCGIPQQSDARLRESISLLTSYPIKHLSCYLLTLTKGNILYSQLPEEDIQLAHLRIIHDEMTLRGFGHYEISNFAKKGFECAHNLGYWKRKSYLGFGPSAHSFDASEQTRFKNVSSLEMYVKKIDAGTSAIAWQEKLTPTQQEIEKWMLALRLEEGFPKDWVTPSKMASLEMFKKEKLIQRHPEKSDYFQLTPKGLALSDQVISRLISA